MKLRIIVRYRSSPNVEEKIEARSVSIHDGIAVLDRVDQGRHSFLDVPVSNIVAMHPAILPE